MDKRTELFEQRRQEMADEELVKIAEEQLSKLCSTGAKSFTMTVPPRIEDTDLIYGELIRRFKEAKGITV